MIGKMGRASTAGSNVDPASRNDPDLDKAMRRCRRDSHVYCYRMLGAFDDAEDHVQEVFLRAWRSVSLQVRPVGATGLDRDVVGAGCDDRRIRRINAGR